MTGSADDVEREQLLDMDDVTKMLSVSKRWLYERTRLGEFPHVRLARKLRFRPADVRAYIDARAKGPK